jgi:hypothetical protein
MRPQWQFEKDGDSRWRWKRLDPEQGDVDSALSFKDATTCMLDAVRYAVQQRRSPALTSREGPLQ